MVRRLALVALLALVVAPSAHAQASDRFVLMPGVQFTRNVEFTSHGPVVVNIVNAPKPGGLYSLHPYLSNGTIIGRQPLTDMEKSISGGTTVAGIDGDLFDATTGDPAGVLIRQGVLDSPPAPQRSSTGIDAAGNLHVDRIHFAGFWKGTGQRRSLVLNQTPGANGVALYTRSWGPTTPAVSTGAVEATLGGFPDARPNTDLSGTVAAIAQTSGGTAIPPGGAVLVARGAGASHLAAEAPLGTGVSVRLTLTPAWNGIVDAIGGGPLIVSKSRPVFRANEVFSTPYLFQRSPRAAVGQRADGRILLVTADGDQPGYSVGMTNFELALTMKQLKCVTAMALEGGESTTLAFEGQVLNRPSATSGERAISDALFVTYDGVYASDPAQRVLSPNGDTVADTQTFTYKLVRSSTVRAVLVGPDKAERVIDTGGRAPGVYTLNWSGTRSDGTPEPEGSWRFTVTATDNQGRESRADRTFSLNQTLGSLAVTPPALALGQDSVRASFTLAHPAQVTVTVETESGIVIRRVMRQDLEAGSWSASWDGRRDSGALAFGGRYQVRVSATNAFGTTDLVGPFTAHR
jgi:flagellar hook assembly protein FlgD